MNDDDASSWFPTDLTDIINDIAHGIDGRPVPTVLARDDQNCLFYKGMVNGIHGESGSGKTWLALYACAQELDHDEHVFYIDHEGDARSTVARLLDLGTPINSILSRFHYVNPDEAFANGGDALLNAVQSTAATLVVIDSTGEGLALHGANPNADDDVARWFREVPRRMADLGPAVVLLDHTAKAVGDGLWPIGSQRKRAAINGIQLYIETLSPFSRDKAGAARLKCAKDRHGHHHVGQIVGTMHVTPDTDSIRITLDAPQVQEPAADGGFRPTVIMGHITDALAEGPLSGNQIEKTITGKATYIRRALDVLIGEGTITFTTGTRSAKIYRLTTPNSTSSLLVPPYGGGDEGRGHEPRPGTKWDEVRDEDEDNQ